MIIIQKKKTSNQPPPPKFGLIHGHQNYYKKLFLKRVTMTLDLQFQKLFHRF